MLLPFTLKALALCGLLSNGLQVTEGMLYRERDLTMFFSNACKAAEAGLDFSIALHPTPSVSKFFPKNKRLEELAKDQSFINSLGNQFLLRTQFLNQDLGGFDSPKAAERAHDYLLHEASTLYAWLANALEGKDSFSDNWFVTKKKAPILRISGKWTAENGPLMEVKVPRRLTLLSTLYRFTDFFADSEQRHFRRAIGLALSAYYLRIRTTQDPTIDHITIPFPGLGNGAKEFFALSDVPIALKAYSGSTIYTVGSSSKAASADFPYKFLEPLIIRAIVTDDDDEYQDHLEALVIEWRNMRTFFQGNIIAPGLYKDAMKRMRLIIKKMSPTIPYWTSFNAFTRKVDLLIKNRPFMVPYRD